MSVRAQALLLLSTVMGTGGLYGWTKLVGILRGSNAAAITERMKNIKDHSPARGGSPASSPHHDWSPPGGPMLCKERHLSPRTSMPCMSTVRLT